MLRQSRPTSFGEANRVCAGRGWPGHSYIPWRRLGPGTRRGRQYRQWRDALARRRRQCSGRQPERRHHQRRLDRASARRNGDPAASFDFCSDQCSYDMFVEARPGHPDEVWIGSACAVRRADRVWLAVPALEWPGRAAFDRRRRELHRHDRRRPLAGREHAPRPARDRVRARRLR